jgi:hypothetical protein
VTWPLLDLQVTGSDTEYRSGIVPAFKPLQWVLLQQQLLWSKEI